MIRNSWILLSVFLIQLLFAKPPCIAVPDFYEGSSVTTGSKEFTEKLCEMLSKATNYIVLRQSDINIKVNNQILAALDPTKIKSIIIFGKSLSADYVLSCKYDKIGDRIVMSGYLVNVPKQMSVFELSEVVIGNDSLLQERIPSIVSQISSMLEEEKSFLKSNESRLRFGTDITFSSFFNQQATELGSEIKVFICNNRLLFGLSGSYGVNAKGFNCYGGDLCFSYNLCKLENLRTEIGVKGGLLYEAQFLNDQQGNITISPGSARWYFGGPTAEISYQFGHFGFNLGYSPMFGSNMLNIVSIGITYIN